MRNLLVLFKSKIKEAYFLPGLSLFLLPLIHFPFLHFSFIAAKELSFKILLTLGLVALLSLGLKKEKIQLKKIGDSLLFSLLCAELVIHALSNFFSDNPLVALYGTYSRGGGFIFELYLFAFLGWNALFLKKEPIGKILKWFWASALLVALYGLLQKGGVELLFKDYATNLFQGRIFSFSGNPSLLGQLMLLSTLVGFYILTQAKTRIQKLSAGMGTLLMVLVMVLSGTRSAVLGLAGVLFLGVMRYRKELWQGLRKFGWKTLFILPLLGLILWIAPSDRFSLSSLSLRSLNSRFEIWQGTVQLVEKNWLLGYGQETFYIHFPEIVTKDFFTLEENINISADEVHNEWLEEIYSHGVPAGLLYLVLLGLVLLKFFKTQSKEELVLAALILGNSIQNQLSFPDPTILVVLAFSWGSLVALESKSEVFQNPIYSKKKIRIALTSLGLAFIVFLSYQNIVKPFTSQRLYTIYKESSEDYVKAVNSLKEALAWTPYYSEPWYELMFVDPSSMGRVLENLEIIDGDSGDVLAWKGNFYSQTDPELAADYYLAALEKNPYQPNWIRAFADMLYTQGDCETALYLYNQYVEAVPDYWKWALDLETHSAIEQKSYETFFKHVPYFWGTLEKMEVCRAQLESTSAE